MAVGVQNVRSRRQKKHDAVGPFSLFFSFFFSQMQAIVMTAGQKGLYAYLLLELAGGSDNHDCDTQVK